jgi:hypothetical protein
MRMPFDSACRCALLLGVVAATLGCASTAPPPPAAAVQLPLQRAWFDGEAVFYVTTDVSDAEVAREKKANFAPRLADTLPRGALPPGQAVAFDKVYAVTNFKQPNIFASAPLPMGHANRDRAYSPLWRMVKVTWGTGRTPRELASEEQVLAAAEAGAVALSITDVILNCPVVHRGAKGALEGATMIGPAP